jgi:hypothetical protein
MRAAVERFFAAKPYQIAVGFLTTHLLKTHCATNPFRAFYPEIRIRTHTRGIADSRLSFAMSRDWATIRQP